MDEPIRIIITQGGTGGAGLGLGDTELGLPKGRKTAFGTEGQDLMSKVGFSSREQKALVGLALTSAKRGISIGISHYADMTGNYIQQSQINDAIEVATQSAGLAIGAATAISLLSPVLASVAIGGMVLNVGFNFGQQIAQFNINVSKQNYQAQRMRERSNTSIANGSRGTYN